MVLGSLLGNKFKESNYPHPDEMRNVGIVGTADLVEVNKLMENFRCSRPRRELIQPSPETGITFFYANTKDRRISVQDIEMSVQKAIRESVEQDLFVIIGNKKKERLKENIARIDTIREFAPETPIIFICEDPEFTKGLLKGMDIDIEAIGEDNIVAWSDCRDKIIERSRVLSPPPSVLAAGKYEIHDLNTVTNKMLEAYSNMEGIIEAKYQWRKLNENLPQAGRMSVEWMNKDDDDYFATAYDL